MDIFLAVLPVIITGASAIFAIAFVKRRVNKRVSEKQKTDGGQTAEHGNVTGTNMALGMCLGMCAGAVLDSFKIVPYSLGVSLGMLVGMVIGMLIDEN